MTGRMKFALVALALWAAPLATTLAKPPAAPPTAPPPTAPAPAMITLLESGAEPRRELRLKAAAGHESTVVITMRQTQIQATPGGPVESRVAPLQLTVAMKVTGVDANGDMHVEFHYVDIKALQEEGVSPAMFKLRSVNAAAAKGTRGTMTVSPRGQARDVRLQFLPGLSPMQRMQAEAVAQPMDQIMMTLPQEPIGEGGQWNLDADIVQGGIRLRQTNTFKLLKVEGDVISVTSNMTLSAKPQDFLTAGHKARLDAYQGVITSTWTLNMAQIAPVSVDSSATIKSTTTFPGVEKARTLNMEERNITTIRRPDAK